MIASVEGSVADVPADRSPRSARDWAAVVALGLWFLVVTKGPVFWIRLEIDREVLRTTGLLEDPAIQIVFVASAALVLAIAAPAVKVLWADRLVSVAFGLFLLAVLSSALWSVAPSITTRQSTMFLLGSAAALVAGAFIRRFDALVALWLAMQVGVGVSAFAWIRDWPRIRVIGGQLAGIYLNKNSLGPVAVMGAASSIALALALWGRRGRFLIPAVLALGVFDVYVWLETDSLTPLIALSMAGIAVVLFVLFVPGRYVKQRRVVGGIGALVCVIGVSVGVAYRAQVTDWLGRRTILSGRPRVWEVVIDYSAERPIGGWGFMAIWTRDSCWPTSVECARPGIVDRLLANGHHPVYEAHSGFLEVLLGVGVVGLVLLLIVVVVVVARVAVVVWRFPSVLSTWSLLLVLFAIATSLTESFIGPNVLPWTVLGVATGQALAVRQRVSASLAAAIGDDGSIDGESPIGHIPDDQFRSDDPTPVYIDATSEVLLEASFDFSFDGSSDPPLDDPLLASDEWGRAFPFGDTDDELDVRR